jgi:hypothetical protein
MRIYFLAGKRVLCFVIPWVPAFAGMTLCCDRRARQNPHDGIRPVIPWARQ